MGNPLWREIEEEVPEVQPLGDTQFYEALSKGSTYRRRRAALKRRVARGTVRVLDVLADPPEFASNMPVGELLACQRGWGPIRVRKACGAVGCSAERPLHRLTTRQRVELATEDGR